MKFMLNYQFYKKIKIQKLVVAKYLLQIYDI